MADRRWHRPRDVAPRGREATLARVVEVVDRAAPETKTELAEAVGVSEQYVSELLQELKADGVVRKAYVVDDDAVYDRADAVSPLRGGESGERGDAVVDLLDRLDEVTAEQYDAATRRFRGEEPERPAAALESLTNERYTAVLAELKSYTLTTDWPGNRVAADLATVATNLEIVGDRACFVADAVDGAPVDAAGVVEERVDDLFAAGASIHDHFRAVLFDGDLAAYRDLLADEERVHRDLDELFELVTAYQPETYGTLVSVTRALERAIYYWVHAAEVAVRLHSGVQPPHVTI
jgi:DNA-binding Lrp family transcriptional regulator